MFKVTIFGGHDGRLGFDGQVYVTIGGACELVRPTIASELIARQQVERDAPGPPARSDSSKEAPEARPWDRHRGRPFFFTMFGSTELKSPTLAEEFMDLRESIQSGLLTINDLDRASAELSRTGPPVGSLTVFGGFDECTLPTENEEIDSLAVHRHLGNVSEQAGRVLQLAIGQRDSERRSSIRQALLVDT